jgi:hypothetical protein
VELSFKWIKQFFGPSGNVVRSSIGIVAMVKKRLNLDASLAPSLQIFSGTLFWKMSL